MFRLFLLISFFSNHKYIYFDRIYTIEIIYKMYFVGVEIK